MLTFLANKFLQCWQLTKPRVTQLAVFCALVGMLLAHPTPANELRHFFAVCGALLGIGLIAGAAFSFNCLLERDLDARMQRTRQRPSASGQLHTTEILVFASAWGLLGSALLYLSSNALTLALTLLTFIGYALVYTVLLKPATPQNIVIGGIAGAMPPALGWAAVTGTVPAQAWLLVLIIFAWTPPHFWSLALYRRQDYLQAALPMLPLTHGERFTCFFILVYSILLTGVSLLPFASEMSGGLYLALAMLLGAYFIYLAWRLWLNYSDVLARQLFRYSILYLTLLFLALLLDRYWPFG